MSGVSSLGYMGEWLPPSSTEAMDKHNLGACRWIVEYKPFLAEYRELDMAPCHALRFRELRAGKLAAELDRERLSAPKPKYRSGESFSDSRFGTGSGNLEPMVEHYGGYGSENLEISEGRLLC